MNAALFDADTLPLPVITRKLPAVQFATPQPGRDLPPVSFNILDASMHIDVIQSRLLTNLHFIGEAQGTLLELQQRLGMPFQAGDLYALYERGYIKLGRHADVWYAEVLRCEGKS